MSSRSFTVVVHEDPKSGVWAEVPELPGCYTQAETLSELEANIKEAIALYLDQPDDPSVAMHKVSILEVTV
jgi:predicted RNase H-like HicB family nuclease